MAACSCSTREAWRVALRHQGYPAFGGHVKRATKSSVVTCDWRLGGCGGAWTTTAKYVDALADYEPGPPHPKVCAKCGRGASPENPLMPPFRCPEYDPQTGIQQRDYRYFHANAMGACEPPDNAAQLVASHGAVAHSDSVR